MQKVHRRFREVNLEKILTNVTEVLLVAKSMFAWHAVKHTKKFLVMFRFINESAHKMKTDVVKSINFIRAHYELFEKLPWQGQWQSVKNKDVKSKKSLYRRDLVTHFYSAGPLPLRALYMRLKVFLFVVLSTACELVKSLHVIRALIDVHVLRSQKLFIEVSGKNYSC